MQPTPTTLRPLTLEAVWDTAEGLIFANGSTTTLDVKQTLRREGYLARQQEVSAAMAYLAEEDQWSYTCNGRHRTYFFEQDTDELLHLYLEREGRFWEVAVVGNTLYRSAGRAGTLGVHTARELSSNRYAFFRARRLLADREQQGYEPAEDVRPDLTVRLPYWNLLNQQPRRVTLAYRNCTVTEKVLGCFKAPEGGRPGFQLLHKQCDYTFSWSRSLQPPALLHLLSQRTFDPLRYPADELSFANERVTEVNNLPVPESEPLTPEVVFQPRGAGAICDLRVANADLAAADFLYADGQQVRLGAHELPREEFMARVRLLCAR